MGDDVFGGDNLGQGFWHAANTLHTCIDYLILDRSPPSPQTVEDAWAFFEQHRDTDPDPAAWTKWWRDDYGWWGRALLHAYGNAARLGLTAPERYLEGAPLCWRGLRTAWFDDDPGCWNDPPPATDGR